MMSPELEAEPTALSMPTNKPEGLIGTPLGRPGMVEPPQKAPISNFDAPVPGESLTTEPGNSPWERPPQFVNPSDAVEFIWKQLSKPANMYNALTLMKQGVPIEAIAKVLLFTGFSEGKWTPDVAMLIAKPVIAILAGLCKAAEIKTKLQMKDRSPSKVINKLLTKSMLATVYNPDESKPIEITSLAEPKGLLSRRSK
jgi:hypothetical protein